MHRAAPLVFVVFAALPLACGEVLVDAAEPDATKDASATSDGGVLEDAALPDVDVAETSVLDAGYDFPFSMTFEDGIYGALGANEPTLAGANTATPLFGAVSASVEIGTPATITRSFPPQNNVYISFYLRIDGSEGGGDLFRLVGTRGTIATVRAQSEAGAFGLTAVVEPGTNLQIGTLSRDARLRIGVKSVLNGDQNAIEIFAGAPGATFATIGYASASAGPASAVVLGNLDGAGLTASFDDVHGQAKAFASPSE